jgi:hypothetical protein
MKTTIAFDWDASELCLVLAEINGRSVRLLDAAVIPFDETVDASEPEQVGAFLRRQLDQRAWQTRQAVGLLKRQDVVLHWLPIPAVPLDEAAQIIHFQATSELALSDEESSYDYLLDHSSDGGAVRALVAVTPACRVEAIARAARAAGLDLQSVALETLARLAALEQWGQGRPTSDGDQIEILLSANHKFIQAIAGAGGELLIDQLVPLSGETPDPVELARVAVQRTIGTLRGQNRPATVGRVAICAPASGEWVQKLQQTLDEPIAVFEPLAAAGLDASPSCDGLTALAGAVAHQTLDRKRRIDFLHPRRPSGPGLLRKYRWSIASAAAALAVAMLGLYAAGELRRLDDELARWRQEERVASDELRTLRSVVQQRDLVAGWLENRHDWLQLYDDVLRLLPNAGELYLTQVSFSNARAGQGIIRLEGYAASEAAVADVAMKLAADGRYRVRTGGIVPASQHPDYPWRFEGELIVLPSTESSTAATEGEPLSLVRR